MRKVLTLVLLLLLCFPSNASAEDSFEAKWDGGTNIIRLTWSSLPDPDEDCEYCLYHNYGDGWVKDSTGTIGNGTTARTITEFPQHTNCQYQIRILKNGRSSGTYTTSNKVMTKTNNFTASVKWTGDDIVVSWTHVEGSVDIWTDGAGTPAYITQNDTRENATISLKSEGFNPQNGELWKFRFLDDENIKDRQVFCGDVNSPGSEDGGSEDSNSDSPFTSGNIPIFQVKSWPVVMFWYKILASLSGVFVFFTLIRCGYQYMHTENSGTRASVIDTLQKCVIALVFIMFTPTFINLLIEINDALVNLFLQTLNSLTEGLVFNTDTMSGSDVTTSADWIGTLFAWPFQVLIDFFKEVFGLHDLGSIIFNTNPATPILNDRIFTGGINTNNPFSQVLANLAFMAFTIYYNAVYLLRRWVIVAVMAATPLIVWVWVMSENKQVIQIWLSEIIQTIFMQTFHALTFGVFFSILCFNGNIPSVIDTTDLAASLVNVGKFIGWFAGIICAGVIIFNSFRIIVATNDQLREQARTGITRAVVGLIIIGLSLSIAGFLTGDQIIMPTPNISSEAGNITLFQVFMMMVAIIPVSKMMSTIFMNFISRIGTVDEDRWAGRSLGMIGGLFGLGMATGKAASGVPNFPTPKNTDDSDSDGISTPPMSPAGNNPNYAADPYGIKNALDDSPVVESRTGQCGSMLRPQDIGQLDGDWVYNHDTGKVQDYDDFDSGNNNYLEPPPPTPLMGIPVPESVDPEWKDTLYNPTDDKFYDQVTGEEVPGIISPELHEWIKDGCVDPQEKRAAEKTKQEEGFIDTLKTSAEDRVKGFDQAGKGAGKVADAIAPGTQGFFEGVSRTAGTWGSSMAAMQAGTNLITKKGFNSNQVQSFTGRDSVIGGLAQMGTATLLSPLGSNVAGKASIITGRGIDVISPPIENIAQGAVAGISKGKNWVYSGWNH